MNCRLLFLAALSALVLTTGIASAQTVLPLLPGCSTLFSNSNSYLPTQLNPDVSGGPGIYANVLSISVLVVTAMLMVIGLVYAIGYSFKIDKMVAFGRTELLEGIFNLAIVVIIVGGIGAADGTATFITNLGATGLNGIQIGGQAVYTSGALTAGPSLYVNMCDALQSNANTLIGQILAISVENVIINVLSSLQISLDPYDEGVIPYTPGFSFSPLAGMVTVTPAINIAIGILGAMAAMMLGIVFLLMFIFFLFPIFLYLGVGLRAFPWTRAAGGSMIALFVAFYIVFPAILYPFVLFNPSAISGAASSSALGCATGNYGPGLSGGIENVLGSVATFFGTTFGGVLSSGTQFYCILTIAAQAAATPVLMLAGLVVSLIISLDLLEILGDLLGAPSLQRSGLLKKMI